MNGSCRQAAVRLPRPVWSGCTALTKVHEAAGSGRSMVLVRPARVGSASAPAWVSASRRSFFNVGWPFADEAGKAIKYRDERVLPYSAEELYDVVADVDKYQEFLPWCTHSRVLFKTPSRMDAELGVGFKMLPGQSYVSQITLNRPLFIKVVVPESSLFHHLTNDWAFHDLSKDGKKSCRTTFDISFEFRSALHKKMADAYFHEVAQNMIQVFSERCSKVYGRPNKL